MSKIHLLLFILGSLYAQDVYASKESGRESKHLEDLSEIPTTSAEAEELFIEFGKIKAKCVGEVFDTESSSKILEKILLRIEKMVDSKDKAPYFLLKKLKIICRSELADDTYEELNMESFLAFIDELYDMKFITKFPRLQKSILNCTESFFQVVEGFEPELKTDDKNDEGQLIKVAKEFLECISPKMRQDLGNEVCKNSVKEPISWGAGQKHLTQALALSPFQKVLKRFRSKFL